MKTRPILITLLVAAHVCVAVAVVAGIKYADGIVSRVLFAVASTAQVGLLSVWAALGRRAAPWRPAALIAATAGWSLVAVLLCGYDSTAIGFLPQIVVMTVVILTAARAIGLRLSLPDGAEPEQSNRWQFPLRRLFAWTTSLAICLGLLILMCRYMHVGHVYYWLAEPNIVLSTLTVNFIVISIFLAWFRPRFVYAVCFAVFSLPALQLFLYLSVYCRFCGPVMHIFSGLEFLVLFGSLLVFRVTGYRLEFKRKSMPLI